MHEHGRFEVLDSVPPKQLPLVIFATAYDKYALHAFDVHAVGLSIEAFDEERFQKALNRARDDFRQRNELARTHFGRCSNRYETTVSFCAAWLSNPLGGSFRSID